MHNRGLNDILIACTDNLRGFTEAIQSVYPKAEVQRCIIHQIRHSINYVVAKDQQVFMKGLTLVYRVATKELAEMELVTLADKWQSTYPIVIRSWQNNWEKLTGYFPYTAPIRKLIYPTNAGEGYHRQISKVTKTKGAFTSDMALLKWVYSIPRNMEKKWTSPLQNWSLTVQQLAIKFGDRLTLDLRFNPVEGVSPPQD